MGKPGKKRGFRSITVQNSTYNWCFSGQIDIRPYSYPTARLLVDFGWYDGWLYLSDPPEQRPPDFAPTVVTPAFVRKAIVAAFNQGWDFTKQSSTFLLSYRNDTFTSKETA